MCYSHLNYFSKINGNHEIHRKEDKSHHLEVNRRCWWTESFVKQQIAFNTAHYSKTLAGPALLQ